MQIWVVLTNKKMAYTPRYIYQRLTLSKQVEKAICSHLLKQIFIICAKYLQTYKLIYITIFQTAIDSYKHQRLIMEPAL